MRYRANPVLVEAEVITAVDDVQPNGWLMVKLTDGKEHNLNPAMIARYIPKPGDYVVTQSDGYVYLNPKEVFERKYSPDAMNALELGAAVRRAGLAGS
jgi:hypothetical protein